MLKNLAYLLPLVGRVSMGEAVKNDQTSKTRPIKHNYFSITTQAKKNGAWLPHPIENTLSEAPADEGDGPEDNKVKRLTEIPIKVLFDNPDLSLNESYVAFDDRGRQLCRGNGETAQMRNGHGGVDTVDCPGSENCHQPCAARCNLLGRFHFAIDVPGSEPTFDAFALRTSGYNSIRAIRAKLTMFQAAFGGLAGLPLKLVMRGKSAKASYDTPFFYADIALNCEFWEAGKKVSEFKTKANEHGIDLAAMEAAYATLATGLVHETIEDVETFEEIAAGGNLDIGGGWGAPPEDTHQAAGPDWVKHANALVETSRNANAITPMGTAIA